jgi:GNAT superfamily N-acetyltransferase
VFVLPAYRGRGIGRAMVQALVDEADARGIRRVTVASSTRARPVYERVGFRVPERILARELGGAV